jgi:hypothetical protein
MRNDIEFLRWTAFKRLSLLFIMHYRYEKVKVWKRIRKDMKTARKENQEADLFIKDYINQASKSIEIPF